VKAERNKTSAAVMLVKNLFSHGHNLWMDFFYVYNFPEFA
jgi:hypothetical protein